MAPKRKERALPVHTTQDSSDEEANVSGGVQKATAPTKADTTLMPKFDKGKVLETVTKLSHPNKLPQVITQSVLDEWRKWHEETPTCLEQIPDHLRLRTIAMPMKCAERLPEPTHPAADQLPAQVELLTYANDDGGRVLKKDELQRNAHAILERFLVADDVPVNSTVVIAAQNAPTEEDGGEPPPAPEPSEPGENTPFFVGDVLDVELDDTPSASSGSSSSNEPSAPEPGAPEPRVPHVRRVLVHYRMPYAKGAFCDNPKKSWKLACLCRQEYNLHHERYTECKSRRDANPQSTSGQRGTVKYVDWLDADRVMETKVVLNKGLTITAVSKRRILNHQPADKSWEHILM